MPKLTKNCTKRQEKRTEKMASRLQETDFASIDGVSIGAAGASIESDPAVLIHLPNSFDCVLRLRFRPGMKTWNLAHAPQSILAQNWHIDTEKRVVDKVMQLGVEQYANDKLCAHPTNHSEYVVAGTSDRTVLVRTDYNFTPDTLFSHNVAQSGLLRLSHLPGVSIPLAFFAKTPDTNNYESPYVLYGRKPPKRSAPNDVKKAQHAACVADRL